VDVRLRILLCHGTGPLEITKPRRQRAIRCQKAPEREGISSGLKASEGEQQYTSGQEPVRVRVRKLRTKRSLHNKLRKWVRYSRNTKPGRVSNWRREILSLALFLTHGLLGGTRALRREYARSLCWRSWGGVHESWVSKVSPSQEAKKKAELTGPMERSGLPNDVRHKRGAGADHQKTRSSTYGGRAANSKTGGRYMAEKVSQRR